ncbi:hypothetical protein MONOS_17003 [Monocercomonoides exilis]|nr:hypothetical protein MONOS_18471 [Monocercomonoides exilis]KAH7830649.1 hypothetical protein MONOS_17003 [Monocercomonoides exilis]
MLFYSTPGRYDPIYTHPITGSSLIQSSPTVDRRETCPGDYQYNPSIVILARSGIDSDLEAFSHNLTVPLVLTRITILTILAIHQ